MKRIRLIQNTDAEDIREKCLGIDIFCKSYVNRGLHIQIKHNGDRKLFKIACQLQREIVEASKGETVK